MIAREGLMSLYRGMAGMIYLALPRFAIAFHGNALGRNLYAAHVSGSGTVVVDPTELNYPEILAGGLFSQLVIVPCLVTPLERVKILMQTDPRHRSQVECIKTLVRSRGRSSLFKGLALTYSRDLPSFATYFLCYERFRHFFRNPADGTYSVGGTLLSGGLAGVCAWFVAIPFDTAKNRHQAKLEKESSIQTVKRLYRQEGWKGFYRGAGPILVRAFPANAAAFLGYEAAIALVVKFGA